MADYKWRSIKDDPPPEDEEVLIMWKDGSVGVDCDTYSAEWWLPLNVLPPLPTITELPMLPSDLHTWAIDDNGRWMIMWNGKKLLQLIDVGNCDINPGIHLWGDCQITFELIEKLRLANEDFSKPPDGWKIIDCGMPGSLLLRLIATNGSAQYVDLMCNGSLLGGCSMEDSPANIPIEVVEFMMSKFKRWKSTRG